MALTSTVLTETPIKLYQSRGCSAITTMYICNASAFTVHFHLYAVMSGGTPSILNTIYHNVPVQCNDTYVIDSEKLVLEDGDALYANVVIPAGAVISNLPVIATVSALGV